MLKHPKITPVPMSQPFTKEEVKEAVKGMKNGKSPGIDEVNVELIKYATQEIYSKIADIYNSIASTGLYPKELTSGIITPLQKPGKKRGPAENLRPIILLSILRKILSIIMMKRMKTRIQNVIPKCQTAYQSGRSTTEQTFAMKVAAERTITSQNEKLHMIMVDMSKAFDSINCKELLNDFQKIINIDELHIIQLMLNVNLQVKIKNERSEIFQTDTGTPQGDAKSAIEFILYFANTITEITNETTTNKEHDYIKSYKPIPSNHLADYDYCINTQKEHFNIICKYADDISKASTDRNEIEHLKQTLPDILRKRDLILNPTKTEEYTITNKDDYWKNIKKLGSYIETRRDITNRKILCINAAEQLTHIFKNNNISLNTKLKIFNKYCSTIFLYNSELWSLTKETTNEVDAFQRRMLRRYVICKQYPQIISNEDVYNITKQII